jgi:RHS repeat-associated protein
LGNSRVSYTEGTNGNAQVVEENSYYAFGLQHKGYGPAASGLGNAHAERYKYNGKELNEELGINWYDYGARNYDAAIGRWMNIDPLAEVSRRWSPYSYCYDNPVRFVDPDGMRAADSKIFNQIDSFENDGWIKEIGTSGNETYTYKADVNTVKQAKAAGFKNAIGVVESVSVTAINGEYSYSLDKTGNVQNHEGESVDASGGFTTDGGTTIDNTSAMDAIISGVDKGANAISTGMAAQEFGLEVAETLARTTDDFGSSASKLLQVTKSIGTIGGYVSAGTAIYSAFQRPTPGNVAKAAGNLALAIIKTNPLIGIVTGVMDATGVSDKIYGGIGNYINDSIDDNQIIIH